MLFRVQGQLDHPFKKFVSLQPWEIVANQFFTKQAANITQLAAFLFAGIDKVSVSVINNDHVFFDFES